MEEMALGEMGMTMLELLEIEPRSLFNKIRGHNNKVRQEWERTRLHAYVTITPYIPEKETVLPQQIMPFPWDDELQQTVKVDATALAEERKKKWAEIDALKAKMKEQKK